MYDVFAPSKTPSTRRIIDNFILKKSYFHVNEHEECNGDPPAEWLDQQAASENSRSVLWRLRKMHGRRRAGTRWVDLIAESLEEQSFDTRRSATFLCKLRAGCVHSSTRGCSPWHLTETSTGPDLSEPHIKSFSDSEGSGHACCTMAVIVRDAKHLRVVLHSMELTNRKPAPPPCVDGSVKSRSLMLTWTCKSADSTVEVLGACSTCRFIAVKCNSRRDEAIDKSFVDTTWRGPSQRGLCS